MSGIPAWLEPILEAQGKANADGISRRARAGYCRRCGEVIMRGLDAEPAGLPAKCDPTPVDRLGEALALLADRDTYELRWLGDRYELEHRDALRIAAHPAGSDPKADVLAAHHCGSAPLPTDPRGGVASPIRAAQTIEPPPY